MLRCSKWMQLWPRCGSRAFVFELLGRLAGVSAIADSSTLSSGSCAESLKQPGLTHKFPEKCFNPLSMDNLSGNRLGLSRDDSKAFSPASSVDCVMRVALQSGSHSDSEIVPQTSRSDGSGIPRNYFTCALFSGGRKD